MFVVCCRGVRCVFVVAFGLSCEIRLLLFVVCSRSLFVFLFDGCFLVVKRCGALRCVVRVSCLVYVACLVVGGCVALFVVVYCSLCVGW